jgi:hypothetical protein
LIPLGRLLFLLRASVIAALVAAVPIASLSRAAHDCGYSNAGVLCQASDHDNQGSTAIGFLIVEEAGDQLDDWLFALGATHSLRLTASILPPVLIGSSVHARDCFGRANPATGPPIIS